ncbi:G/U mismatch-specific uracil-DNA glycosylase [Acetoanaerobium noterae]|uniref:G/U mismatch-specific uracil-DNA glycosylase n=1 Tax=Acetoanaerobium noterae TaxID=745369 RepID=A0A1T5BG57_9FIRM|nr:DNA-deoxyinosine glycosylase [Acetoanaerobium noterae]SKB46281.1 G/U mismatch-specific uracil-DNA glycosylase [Acetoanaerobium noterae]
MRASHEFPPVFDENSEILILGSFPSVKSRQESFFYANPQNRFWKLMAQLLNESTPKDTKDKIVMLKKHKIALWDVIESCDIVGSSDSSISNVVPVDISQILSRANIIKVYANGGKAFELYNKYLYPKTQLEITKLPSTSPANAGYSFDKLLSEWKKILE